MQRLSESQDSQEEPPTKQRELERDAEIFDDTDFYEAMLKELLEGSSRSADSLEAHKSRRSRKKLYSDRHGSKGRKLR